MSYVFMYRAYFMYRTLNVYADQKERNLNKFNKFGRSTFYDISHN